MTDRFFYHLPGLFEFYDLYSLFLPLWRDHREYFIDGCEIGSIYGAPCDCLWGGGRVGYGDEHPEDVAALMREYGISSRLTFSNSLLSENHLSDSKCNSLCRLFEHNGTEENGIIIASDILSDHIRREYPGFYLVSSTTKVITDIDMFKEELGREEYRYVVPDFRLNKRFEELDLLTSKQKAKVEFLCNECCSTDCKARRICYENVSRKSLGEDCDDHICIADEEGRGYRFSEAMKNPAFIGTDDIIDKYLPMGFDQFKIEGRSLGSAVVLEMILYYMVRSEYRIKVREEIYLDSMLDLF